MKQQQRIHADVITDGAHEPIDVVTKVLNAAGIGVVDAYGNPATRIAEPNRERLIALARWAAGEDTKRRLGLPNEWNQTHWFRRPDAAEGTVTDTECGTACCIAGKVAAEDGGKPRFPFGSIVTGEVLMPDGTSHHVRNYAKEALGLDEEQAERLFEAGNSLEDVLNLIAEFIGTELED
jgi:hypothetical protein